MLSYNSKVTTHALGVLSSYYNKCISKLQNERDRELMTEVKN